MMDMIPVESSQIEAVGFEAAEGAAGLLRVRFRSGAAYEYRNVDRADFDRLLAAPSKGLCFQEIKARPDLYPCRKVEQARAPEGRG